MTTASAPIAPAAPAAPSDSCAAVARPKSRAPRRGRRPATQTVLARVVATVIDRAVAQGMQRESLIEAAGLTDVDLTNGDSRVSVSTQVALWRLIAMEISDPGFGVRGGASITVRQTGLLGYVMSASSTLGAALCRLARYSHIITDAVQLTLGSPSAQHVALAATHPDLGSALPLAVDYRLAAVLSVCRQITAETIVPFQVDFNYEQPASTLEHRRFFGCPLQFGQPEAKLVFFERDLALAVPHGDETLAGYLSEHAEQVLRTLVTGSSIKERVRSAIWAALGDGRPTLERIAATLEIPSRTLQRHLAEEGTSLHHEIEHIRKTMAMTMVRNRTISIDEVAFLLGYAESSTLFRSFKRWTAMTPRQYRSAHA
jgi:AraC-like DNA-binding protein